MRKLTPKQKTLIHILVDNQNLQLVDELSDKDWKYIESLNDYETLHQDIQREILDYRFSESKLRFSHI